MLLIEKQQTFTILVSHLIKFAYDSGFTLTFGDAYRDPKLAAYYASIGSGIKNSLHSRRLAIDLMLFKGVRYLTNSDDYKFLGEHWESFTTPDVICCWGGRFSRPDGNHFSIADGGQR